MCQQVQLNLHFLFLIFLFIQLLNNKSTTGHQLIKRLRSILFIKDFITI